MAPRSYVCPVGVETVNALRKCHIRRAHPKQRGGREGRYEFHRPGSTKSCVHRETTPLFSEINRAITQKWCVTQSARLADNTNLHGQRADKKVLDIRVAIHISVLLLELQEEVGNLPGKRDAQIILRAWTTSGMQERRSAKKANLSGIHICHV